MKIVDRIHGGYVHQRRIRVLSRHLCNLIPSQAHVLDVGCGDGQLAQAVISQRPDLRLEGLETLVRSPSAIPVQPFDGRHLPYQDREVDVVMFVDVLHHAESPALLLREAMRIVRQFILIKDHTRDGWLAETTLRFMDRTGNRRYGVVLPYRYWSRQEWDEELRSLGVKADIWITRLGLYPWPAGLVFERSLHFLARLFAPSGEQIGATPNPTEV